MSDGVARTKILLLGLRRSGKTSIQQVLFNDMIPKETFYLDATMRTVKHTYDTVIPLEIWDCPGNITVETLGAPLSVFSTVVFVIDIRDLYNQPISRLVEFIVAAYHQNPSLNFEIFVHKAEKLQEDEKIENFRQINERVMDRLVDVTPPTSNSNSPNIPGPHNSGSGSDLDFTDFVEQQMVMNFHLTSIFDHSLHQAFSSVLQRLITSLEYFESLLNTYCANSQAFKVFLFDARSRLYVATDHSPVDATTHNLCCDNLAMLNAFGGLYRSASASPPRRRRGNPDPRATTSNTELPAAPTPPPSAASFGENSFGLSGAASPVSSSRPHSPIVPATPTAVSQTLRMDASRTTSLPTSTSTMTTSSSASSSNLAQSPAALQRSLSQPKPHRLTTPQDLFYPSGATSLRPSSSLISMPGTTIMWHLLTSAESIVEELGLEDVIKSRSDMDMREDEDESEPSSVLKLNTSNPPVTVTTPNSNTNSSFSTYPNPTLILLILLPTSVFETRRGLIELNAVLVREGVQEIIDVEREARGTRRGAIRA